MINAMNTPFTRQSNVIGFSGIYATKDLFKKLNLHAFTGLVAAFRRPLDLPRDASHLR
jgi:hypothetical protein